MKQYATTTGEVGYIGGRVVEVDHPEPPDGDGWELVSTAGLGEHVIVWTWVREEPEAK